MRGQSQVIKLTLKDDLDFDEALAALRRFDRVVEWVEPDFIVNRASTEEKTGGWRLEAGGWGVRVKGGGGEMSSSSYHPQPPASSLQPPVFFSSVSYSPRTSPKTFRAKTRVA
ncbi:MAG: hypothetical protein MOB07_05370, partial [Acidobacteria bacterium]|nr:hypothetical protein [Acidobacteriota bacterium]